MQNSCRTMTFNRLFVVLASLFFLFLLAVLWIYGYTPTNDTDAYLDYARICLQQKEPYPNLALIQGQPFIWHPGPVNMIALSLWLFGSFVPLLVVYCMLKAVTAWLVAKISQHFFGNKVALTAMVLFICYPNNWGQSTTLLSEIPMICLGLLSVWILLSRKHYGILILAGGIMAVANWFRPIAGIYILSVAWYFLLFSWRDLFRKLAPFCIGFVLVIALIGAETRHRTGHFIYKSESFWYNMADDAYSGATPDAHFGQPLFPEGTPRYIENREELDCFQCEAIWRERCMEWLLQHPLEYLEKVPWRLWYMYKNDIDNLTAFLSDKTQAEANYITLPLRSLASQWSQLSGIQWLALFCTLCYILLMCLSVAGTCKLMRARQWNALFLPLFVILFGTFATVLLIQGETRFKVPFMPFVFMLAAVALCKLEEKH